MLVSNLPCTRWSVHRTLICNLVVSVFWECLPHRAASIGQYPVKMRLASSVDLIKTQSQVTLWPSNMLRSRTPSLEYTNKINVLYFSNENLHIFGVPSSCCNCTLRGFWRGVPCPSPPRAVSVPVQPNCAGSFKRGS